MKSFRKNIKGNSILNLQGFKKIIPSFLILNFSFLINIQAQNSLDQLQYNYYSNTNRLEYLTDAVSSVTARIDIDNQSAGNYSYDALGQLTQDISEGILDIDWTVSGKVKKVSIDDDGNSVADRTLEFKYDALGNRVKKIETDLTTGNPQLTTIYIRNATGDLISIYESDGTTTERTEVCISGVGTDKAAETSASAKIKERNLGNKSYELKDHLGNVRVTVSDVKEPSNLSIFQSSILNSTDYYAFGMQMPGRTMSLVEGRYGFQGKEKDDELKGNGNSYDFGARMYDPRVGRWLSRDPLETKYPDLSPYNFCANNPINMVDPDGKANIALTHLWEVYKDDGLACAVGEALSYTDVDDLSVLMTGMHTNGDAATKTDYALAAGSLAIPIVAGGVVSKVVKNLPEASKVVDKVAPLLTSDRVVRLVSEEGVRDVVVVNTSNGSQAFYRSTGKNSGKPGEWLPFDGICRDGWFDKHRFSSNPNGNMKTPDIVWDGTEELKRYGTEELRGISQELGKKNIGAGEVVDGAGANDFIKQQGAEVGSSYGKFKGMASKERAEEWVED